MDVQRPFPEVFAGHLCHFVCGVVVLPAHQHHGAVLLLHDPSPLGVRVEERADLIQEPCPRRLGLQQDVIPALQRHEPCAGD